MYPLILQNTSARRNMNQKYTHHKPLNSHAKVSSVWHSWPTLSHIYSNNKVHKTSMSFFIAYKQSLHLQLNIYVKSRYLFQSICHTAALKSIHNTFKYKKNYWHITRLRFLFSSKLRLRNSPSTRYTVYINKIPAFAQLYISGRRASHLLQNVREHRIMEKLPENDCWKKWRIELNKRYSNADDPFFPLSFM